MIANHLLDGLPPRAFARLEPHLEGIDLPVGARLEEPQRDIAQVIFPLSGIASVIALGPGELQVEAGLFGRDGMTGTALLLGAGRPQSLTIVQVPGRGLRLAADALLEALEDRAVQSHFLRFVHALSVQTAQTALAFSKGRLPARLARWLLMCRDRIDGDDLQLTHEFMALMLGARRAGVTEALHVLEGMQLIRSTRGMVRNLDRPGLKEAAGGFYGRAEAEYARLFAGAPGASGITPSG
ncbi:Crp/Fnr family transcriptional regulator [Pseudoroseicyclus aestuarii]|uniref:CRP-like cAMP-binding protein n=1 Tax=Pseudoroseicyclus aestuarii TaxID=1795041 RepID=A0A318ST40_9RHOB|nr:helix-turn-helix domain-containing protein [Pseudoroseicyclus aestuarii]PYE84632.1 CRP-like cAMP-binding protein [Pseudoroseicyclus aestuarii]